MRNFDRTSNLLARFAPQARYFLKACFILSLLCIGPAFQAQQRKSNPPPPSATNSDNYYALREKYIARLKLEERERERQRQREGARPVENQFEIEFHRWDNHARDHLNAGSRQRGQMMDMSLPLRTYFEAARRAREGGRAAQTVPLVCPSAGLGNWISLGPSTYVVAGVSTPIMGKVTSVYPDPSNPGTAYAGAAQGGLFKTVNNGASWTSLTDASYYPALGVTSIAVHPTTPTTIYISTRNGSPGGGNYGFGILKSTNGGTTWQEIFTLATYNNQTNFNIGEGSLVSKIMLHPQAPNYIYALAAHYVFRSPDAGATWEKVLEITPPNPNADGCGYRIVDIDIIPGASGIADSLVIASTVRTAWLGLAVSPCGSAKSFLSSAGGAMGTFNEISNAVHGGDPTDRIATALQPGNSSEFFVAYQYKTDNFGNGHLVLKKYDIASGTTTAVGMVNANGVFQLGGGYWNLEFEFSLLDPATFYLAGTTVYRGSLTSAFNAANPVQISSYWATHPSTCVPLAQTHADIRAMTVSNIGGSDRLLIGSDGGTHQCVLNPLASVVYNSTTANWDDLTGPGLAINEFFDINGLESNSEIYVAGAQDNGTFEYNNGVWTQRVNYDGWRGTINSATGEYFGMSNAGARKWLTGTTGPFLPAVTPSVGGGPIVSDPNVPGRIYGGGASLYRSNNFGGTWTTLPSPPGMNSIRAIHLAPSDSNRIYVSREGPTWNQANLAGRLFRSNNGGSTWTDIGVHMSNLPSPPLAWATVSDIAVADDDANRVWVSLNGFWSPGGTSISGVNRVLYSGDGGNTWSDFTYNLLAFPISTLVYRRGSNSQLFAGTDVGVFSYNAALQAWECFSNQLPVVPVTQLEINYCKNQLVASTWGRGVYKSDLPALPPKVLNASTTWSGMHRLSNDLTIAPGATLTLTGTLNMSKDKRIIVQRGATLNVNGGKITNPCGEMWYGIEVWGTASAAQTLAGAQGKVIIQNGATIENAVAAITIAKDANTTPDLSYTGGIVEARNSYFYNNRSSAQFLPYQWMSGPNVLNNRSYFRNCTFETNRLLNDATLQPSAHVSLREVKNVGIEGCKFNNTAPTTVFGVNNRGVGVESFNTQYTVDDQFNTIISPPAVIAPSVFNGLTYGVRADFAPGINKKASVQNSDFNNVQRGVQINNSVGSFISANNFNALPNTLTTSFAAATWGVRVNNASGLSVRDNTVTGAAVSYQNNYGVIIDNCGNSTSNLVRGNRLKNLYIGIYAQGNNGSGGNGVQFRCNVFQPSMAYQLAVQAAGTLADQGGVCSQGSTADNTFFAQASPPGSQINSLGVTFNYYASGTMPTNTAGPVVVINCAGVSGECLPADAQRLRR